MQNLNTAPLDGRKCAICGQPNEHEAFLCVKGEPVDAGCYYELNRAADKELQDALDSIEYLYTAMF